MLKRSSLGRASPFLRGRLVRLCSSSADNKTLASTLHIGEHTLRNHLSRIYDKLGVPNRLELYVFVQRHVEHVQPRF